LRRSSRIKWGESYVKPISHRIKRLIKQFLVVSIDHEYEKKSY